MMSEYEQSEKDATRQQVDNIFYNEECGSINRREVIRQLKSIRFTFGHGQDYPFEGYTPGSIDALERYYYMGRLSAREFSEVYDYAVYVDRYGTDT